MKDRLLKFLSINNLTATKFADEIGVQRSSISHILSGRNKPSYDFINKTLENYTDLNAEWLITGKGEMFKSTNLKSSDKFKELDLFSNNQDIGATQKPVSTTEEKMESTADEQSNISPADVKTVKKSYKTQQSIKKVIIFYTDGSFEEYNPSVS
jgi:transcriptional regulator with XRE-family HTH domain